MAHTSETGSAVRLCAVGDIKIERPDPQTPFEPGMPVFRAADVLFGNCEAVYADNVSLAPSASIPVLCTPEHGKGLGYAGFDVMSMANNHTVDGGHEGLMETLEGLHQQNIATCGAGAEVRSARAPAILERGGVKIAFLAYSCVYPAGYEAREDRPGLAAIRTHTIYYPSEMDAFQSGGAPEQATVVNPVDLRTVCREIKEARQVADLVVVSVHSGDGSRPAVILDYERQLARAAVDAGAGLYLAHHHHMLRGAEIYRGAPIFYGLNHYVFDIPNFEDQVPPSIMARMAEHAGEYGYGPREGYPLLPLHEDARMTAIVVCDLDKTGVLRAGVVPCVLNPEGQPVPYDVESEQGSTVVDYLRRITKEAGVDLEGHWWPRGWSVGGFPVLELRPGPAADDQVSAATLAEVSNG